jgi:glycerol-3-phosphate dehydrogenase (NAD(P)+)
MTVKNQIERAAVIGAGSWGTAIATVLSRKAKTVMLWGHQEEHVHQLIVNRENRRHLPGVILSDNILPTSDLRDALKKTKIICAVVPSHSFRAVFEKMTPLLENGAIVVSAIKGVENSTLMTMTQIMDQILKQQQRQNDVQTAVLSGPSFAKEVAQGIPTAVTVGCKDLKISRYLQTVFGTETFRVYASTDVIGLEISAALKNIIAIAAGICDGLGYGMNTRAALITRGLAEITRLGIHLGAERETFSGLSGLGDLVLTCTGDLSRNRFVGMELGRGRKLVDILAEMKMVAEGVKTTKSIYDLTRPLHIEMPILEQVYAILYEDKECSLAVKDLLARELKVE